MGRMNSVPRLILRFILFLLALIMLLPMAQTLLYSFSSIADMQEYMKTRSNFDTAKWMDSRLIPNMFSLSQYYHILIKDNTVLYMFLNSAMYALMILAGQTLIVPAMAFALSKFSFRGRGAIFFIIILLMILPFQVTMVPNVLTLRRLGLLNTIWAVVLPMCCAPFFVFLIRQFMVGLPDELIEAASIDGAGPFRVFISIILPVCRPILGAAAALSFAESWNLVEQPLTYLTDKQSLMPLSVMFNQIVQSNTGFEFAGAALYILPALFVYMFFQQDIISGIQLTEMK